MTGMGNGGGGSGSDSRKVDGNRRGGQGRRRGRVMRGRETR